MSLVIFVSPKTVIISKFKLEFPFQPPARNLTQAAIGAYQLLRQSESIQIESSRDERQEAITLLRQYGLELFQAVIPPSHRSSLLQAGGLFIYSVDRATIQLPWELLYDETSFFALTQGVVRISESKAGQMPDLSREAQLSLKIGLTSYSPIPSIPPGNRFINYVEALGSGPFSGTALIDFSVDGNASYQSLPAILRKHPNLFLFAGHESESGWLLDGKPEADWFRQELEPAMREAVNNGLRILILMTSGLLRSDNRTDPGSLSRLFDLGIPYIITVNGRIARHRFQEYFQNFVIGLLREDNILRAHRQAINAIHSNLPLSWDWSWIQLHLNQKALEQGFETPLPPFRFINEGNVNQYQHGRRQNSLFNARRFQGNAALFSRISALLLSETNERISYLQSQDGSPIEEYLQEFFRRLLPRCAYKLNLLFYQRWGYHDKQRENLPATPLGNLFPFYFGHKNVSAYFNQYLIDRSPPAGGEPAYRFLVVYRPPERHDGAFDAWISDRIKDGWRIVFLSDDRVFTKLTMETVPTAAITAAEVQDAFEDDLPEQWIDLVRDPLPEQLTNISLLKIAQHSGNEAVINLFLKKRPPAKLWQQILHSVLAELSANRFRIFLALYLTGVPCSKNYLGELLNIKDVDAELDMLLRLHLLSGNLTESHVWIPINLCLVIERFELISKKQLHGFGNELLQRQTAMLKGDAVPEIIQICGFQNTINKLAGMGPIENPLQRNLQFGRKLSRLTGVQPPLFYPNICTSMEMVLAEGNRKDIQKTVVSILDILSNLPLEQETIRIYQWLIKSEEKKRNWQQMADLLMKLASVYIRLNMKEKAIGLVTSAIELNNDIKNFTNRHANLITIALLLLDLDEISKVQKLIDNTDFDLKKLSEEDIAKLWLVDGHLLFQSGKISEAASSLRKMFQKPPSQIPGTLSAKTHLIMAEAYRKEQKPESCFKHLHQAALHFEKSGNMERAAELHRQILEHSLAAGLNEEAAIHLEWLYLQVERAGDKTAMRKMAYQLGGIYFKTGHKEKSTHYYSIAQGI